MYGKVWSFCIYYISLWQVLSKHFETLVSKSARIVKCLYRHGAFGAISLSQLLNASTVDKTQSVRAAFAIKISAFCFSRPSKKINNNRPRQKMTWSIKVYKTETILLVEANKLSGQEMSLNRSQCLAARRSTALRPIMKVVYRPFDALAQRELC